jgi:YfiH family protein
MLQSATLREIPAIKHLFFTRGGGVSEGIYRSLNCGPGSKDDPKRVEQNRARAALLLGAAPTHLCTLNQVHGSVVRTVEQPFGTKIPEADAMVTKVPDIALGILTADCAPVLFVDPAAQVIGAAHAGWKGALYGVLQETLIAMEHLGAQRERVHAAIGPCIGQASYEVDAAFRDRFLTQDTRSAPYFRDGEKDGHFQFDLSGYVQSVLLDQGLRAVDALNRDTYPATSGFFSFRRATHLGEPDYGRQLSAIMLRPRKEEAKPLPVDVSFTRRRF